MTPLVTCKEAFMHRLALERSLALKTQEAYGRDIKAFIRFLVERKKSNVEEIIRQDVKDFLELLRKEHKKSSTRARMFVSVRQFLAFLKEFRYTAEDYGEALETPKRNLVLPKVLSEDVAAKLVNSVNGSTPRDLRDRAILEFLYGGGFRVSELCELKLSDIFLNDDVIRCFGKGSKERIVPLGSSCKEALGNYLLKARDTFTKGNVNEQHVFVTRLGKAFSRMGIFKILKERAATAGVDPAIVSPHVLRHCFASHLLAHGADIRAIQELLGHASVATTQMYTHVDSARLSEVHRKFHPRSE